MNTPSQWKYFTVEELSCKGESCCGGEMKMQGDFMRDMAALRRDADFPFIVTSGYRCPEYNDYLYVQQGHEPGKHLQGPHTTGRALDILAVGWQAMTIINLGVIYHGMYGVGLYQKGPRKDRYIHIDNIERTELHESGVWCWTY